MLAFVDFFIQVPSRTDLQVQTSIYVNLLCHKRQTNEWKMRSVETMLFVSWQVAGRCCAQQFLLISANEKPSIWNNCCVGAQSHEFEAWSFSKPWFSW